MSAIDFIPLNLVEDFHSIAYDLRMVRENLRHLFLALEELLLRVTQPLRVVNICIGRETDKSVMYRSVLFAYEVHVVGGNHFYPVFLRKLKDLGTVLLLILIHIKRQSRDTRLVHHHLKIVIVPENLLMPPYGLIYSLLVSCKYPLWYLPGKTSGTAYNVVMIFLYHLMTYAGLIIHTFNMSY